MPIPAILAFLVLAVLVHLRVAFLTEPWLTRALVDADGYTRLLRVGELQAGGAWHAARLPWLGAPEGLALHWTRPLDLLILLGAWPAMLAGTAPDAALYWSGALLCPVLHLAACLAAVWAARALWPPAWCWFAGIILLADMSALGYSIFGRADHHTLILLCCVVGLGFAMRAAIGRPGAALRAGLAFGLGIWVSPETLLVAIPALAALGLLWLHGNLAASRAGAKMAAGMALAVAFALPLERPPADLLAVAQDRVSVQHLALAFAIAAVFAAAARLPPRLGAAGRAAAGGVLAAAGAGALLAVWPDLLLGPIAAARGEMGLAFLDSAQEMQPLRFDTRGGIANALSVIGGVPAALIALAIPLLRGAPPEWRAAALVVALPLLACLAATIGAQRFGADLAAPLALAAAGFVPMLATFAERAGPLLRLPVLAAAAFLAIVLPYAASAMRGAAPAAGAGCDAPAIARWLRAAEAGAPVLMADDHNAGPILAHAGGVRAVSGPYHQLAAAFADTAALFNATDEEAARAIAARRDIALLLVCPTAAPLGAPWRAEGLRARLLAGDPPAWLRERPLPPALRAGGARLYAVSPAP